MKKFVGTVLAATLLGGAAAYAEGPHWTYSGHEGPEHWGELDPTYELCGKGKNQTPIDLTGFIEAKLPPIAFDYKGAATEILNNGHTVQANFAVGDTITVSGHTFTLKQVHFHTPSENLIEGQSFPLEGHLVHADADGNLAVVAVMYKEGAPNPALAKLWSQMPEQAGEHKPLEVQVVASELLPAKHDYFRFNGSLTTPPCSEGVWWLVMKKPATISKEQVEQFAHVMHHPNNRPVQNVNARPVLR